jgi:hypothetical protein
VLLVRSHARALELDIILVSVSGSQFRVSGFGFRHFRAWGVGCGVWDGPKLR